MTLRAARRAGLGTGRGCAERADTPSAGRTGSRRPGRRRQAAPSRSSRRRPGRGRGAGAWAGPCRAPPAVPPDAVRTGSQQADRRRRRTGAVARARAPPRPPTANGLLPGPPRLEVGEERIGRGGPRFRLWRRFAGLIQSPSLPPSNRGPRPPNSRTSGGRTPDPRMAASAAYVDSSTTSTIADALKAPAVMPGLRARPGPPAARHGPSRSRSPGLAPAPVAVQVAIRARMRRCASATPAPGVAALAAPSSADAAVTAASRRSAPAPRPPARWRRSARRRSARTGQCRAATAPIETRSSGSPTSGWSRRTLGGPALCSLARAAAVYW